MNEEEIEKKLKACREGSPEERRKAINELITLVYDMLRKQAHFHIRDERVNHTLETTGLVHEAYLKLINQRFANLQNYKHFQLITAEVMRRILVDHARGRHRKKRGGKEENLPLEDEFLPNPKTNTDIDMLELDDLLKQLKKLNPRQATVFKLRYFGGLTVSQVTEILSISSDTVNEDWKMAKRWLRLQIGNNR